MKIVGLVLAGGRSSRFGREKAVVEAGGRPLIAWVVDVLRPVCAAVAINARPASLASAFGEQAGFTTLADRPADPQGPLAGVRAGLAWAAALGADALVTAPCDTPFLPADLVSRLAVGWAPGDGARVASSPAGLEPLTALWPVAAARDLIEQILAEGRHPPIRQVLEQLKVAEIAFADLRAFSNLNTPADYAAAMSPIFGREEPG